MNRTFTSLMIGIFCACNLCGQIEADVAKVLATKDFVAFKSFADSLANSAKRIQAHWEYLRDVTTEFQEGVFYFERSVPDEKNAAISTVHTFRVTLITTTTNITYYYLARKKYKKVGNQWEPYFDGISVYRNDSAYAIFKSSFKDIFHIEINESELFITDFVYGDNCGFAGSPTEGRLQINNFVRNKDKAGLLAWLQSPNTEKQVYAIDGLWQLNKLGIQLSKEELAMINFVKDKKGSMYVCSGCIHFHDKISDVTKEFKF